MLSKRIAKFAVVGLAALALAGCASSYDRRTNNAMMGAGLGAAAGAVVSQGDPIYAVGGAAVGGLLGHVLTEDNRRSRSWDNDRNYRQAKHRDHRRSHKRHHRHRR